jgi:hypothetical protein
MINKLISLPVWSGVVLVLFSISFSATGRQSTGADRPPPVESITLEQAISRIFRTKSGTGRIRDGNFGSLGAHPSGWS